MRTYNLFKEYIWLIDTIRKSGKISLKEINERWIDEEISEGIPFADRTFRRHLNAIQDMFGINIACDKRNGFRYYIENMEVLRGNSIQKWMLSTLSISNMIGDGLSMQDRIIVESAPVDNEYLPCIINAMKRKCKVCITYHKYGEEQSKSVVIEPYCLKMFKQRWYVLGHLTTGEYKTYSLDRIKDISITNEHFETDESFDAQTYFNECFGIVKLDNVKCERLVLRAYNNERFYLRDLPLHHSQKEIMECEDYAEFEYHLRPTYDFAYHLLSRAANIQVISPEWFADKMCSLAESIKNRYK